MAETPVSLDELRTYAENIRASSAIMFATLNNIYQLHALDELTSEEDKIIAACKHCSDIADAIVHFPCPTVQVLTEAMVVTQERNEETPAE